MNQKSRVTLYICTNADGSDKVPLAMIGHAENPRCFKTNGQKLAYFQQKKAWSDGSTFKLWIKLFQKHIKKTTKERVLLLLDNCGPHTNKMIKKDKQVHVEFLPKNTTSAYQPMDAGVIAMLKKTTSTSSSRPLWKCGRTGNN